MPLAWGNSVLFQFIFRDKKTMSKIQLGTPWVYDKYLLNVHPWELGLKGVSPLFDICNMWIQIWNIPLQRCQRMWGCKIGNTLGGICDVVIPENGSKDGWYMRLKVMMNTTKPLPRGKLIKLGLEQI